MRVLITGGAGFIGSHAARAFAAAGWDVVTLDDGSGTRAPDASAPPSGVHAAHGDVRDPDTVAARLAGVDVVCHQAAKVGLGVEFADMAAYLDINATGTAVLLTEMARAGVGRLVLASSMVVYGEGGYRCPEHGTVRPGPRTRDDLAAGRFEPRCPDCAAALRPRLVDEDTPADPRNAYAASKLAAEQLAAVWARETGGTAVALRYHNVYGPGMPRDTPYAGVAALFRTMLAHGEAPLVFEDGAQRRDFVHVADIAGACVAAAGVRGGGPGTLRPYNAGSGEPRTVGELAAALAHACGGPEPVVTGRYRLGDVRHITADSTRARRELGFTPAIPFDAGIAEFAAPGPHAAVAPIA